MFNIIRGNTPDIIRFVYYYEYLQLSFIAPQASSPNAADVCIYTNNSSCHLRRPIQCHGPARPCPPLQQSDKLFHLDIQDSSIDTVISHVDIQEASIDAVIIHIDNLSDRRFHTAHLL